ncbi:MFS transporter [Streptomyces sp. 8L]|uniref:MFS transporter n=1 Tax=Streptomyces sp. 8L TaxID=2877242 RepID=UPI001CD48C07|nr:MFS transporter [Streptomyces sp. 8L]MCA1222601.1 MFS transporter [Streptomyces sp. 8L]
MASVSTVAPAAPALLSPGRPGYRRLSLALFVAGIATFALLYSTQALLPAVSDGLRVSPGDASWTVAAATGGLAVAVVPLSALSERFGRRSMMTASLVVAVAVGLAVPFAPNLAVLIALRAVQGAALAGLPASAMAFLAEEVEAGALVSAIGLFVAGNSIGGMSGRIFTGWISQAWGWRAALLAVGVAAVACAVIFRVMVPKARNFTPRQLSPRGFGRTVGEHLANPLLLRLYAIGALFMVVFGGVYTVIGYRLSGAPFSLPQGIVGSVFVVYLVGTFASAASGRVVARLGRRGALYAALCTTAAGLLVTLVDSIAAVIAGLVLITAGFFTGHSVASSSVSRTVTQARAQASALYQAAYYLGSSAGGAIGAAAFHSAGWAATVGMGLVAMAGVAGLTLYGTVGARRTERRAARGAPAA